ncbi:MAG: hypothetical protein EBE86_006300 [Hormoscilla sp. GUM202]|nr:hypothetical protein [Hormoscilla sp. GUM202]
MKLLCLSNGHGEDAIAVRILRQLKSFAGPLELAALPLVGEGVAYRELGIPIIGPVKPMPSGGFIYMDGRQLWRDLRGGLLGLTIAQWQAVRRWVGGSLDGRFFSRFSLGVVRRPPDWCIERKGKILAVGDIVPLLFAWWSGGKYAFVGTAKSEYFLRDEAGVLPGYEWQAWSSSVYLPWERWLMSSRRCQAVFPRDSLTAARLKPGKIPVFDLGNPMMDDLQPQQPIAALAHPNGEKGERDRQLTILLLPGSRSPEAYENWQLLLQTAACILGRRRSKVIFAGAIAPLLTVERMGEMASSAGWLPRVVRTDYTRSCTASMTYIQKHGTLLLTEKGYNQCLHWADVAIAMAGTATEQFVGLGKPAIAIPGGGPQFTPAFAEAQSRLLGPSLVLVQQPGQVADLLEKLLRDPDWLQLIYENGQRRMGKPGAARRIATCLTKLP